MIFFTSDHHFSHKNIITLCDRPFKSVEEMDEEMIRRWNETVKPEDTVYYLGDFSLSIKPVEKYVHRLNGKKYLCAGNHDKCHIVHKDYREKERIYLEYGFLQVFYDLYNVRLKEVNEYLTFSHFPYNNGEDIRYQEFFPIPFNSWLLHGHVHNKWKIKDKQINVGVDIWDFYPVSLDKIIEIIGGAK